MTWRKRQALRRAISPPLAVKPKTGAKGGGAGLLRVAIID